MGIEPTADDPKPPAYGFEVRAGHQTESASGWNIRGPQIEGTSIFSGLPSIGTKVTKASPNEGVRATRPRLVCRFRSMDLNGAVMPGWRHSFDPVDAFVHSISRIGLPIDSEREGYVETILGRNLECEETPRRNFPGSG